MNLIESIVEDAALGWFGELGYAVGHGELAAERDGFGDVVFVRRLREAIWRLNPAIPFLPLASLRETLPPEPLSEEPGLYKIEPSIVAAIQR